MTCNVGLKTNLVERELLSQYHAESEALCLRRPVLRAVGQYVGYSLVLSLDISLSAKSTSYGQRDVRRQFVPESGSSDGEGARRESSSSYTVAADEADRLRMKVNFWQMSVV